MENSHFENQVSIPLCGLCPWFFLFYVLLYKERWKSISKISLVMISFPIRVVKKGDQGNCYKIPMWEVHTSRPFFFIISIIARGALSRPCGLSFYHGRENRTKYIENLARMLLRWLSFLFWCVLNLRDPRGSWNMPSRDWRPYDSISSELWHDINNRYREGEVEWLRETGGGWAR